MENLKMFSTTIKMFANTAHLDFSPSDDSLIIFPKDIFIPMSFKFRKVLVFSYMEHNKI